MSGLVTRHLSHAPKSVSHSALALPLPLLLPPKIAHALPVPFFSFPAFSSALLVATDAQQEGTRRPFCLIRCGWVSILSYLVHWCTDILVYQFTGLPSYLFTGILVYLYTGKLVCWYTQVSILVYWGGWFSIILSYLVAGWNVSRTYSLLLLPTKIHKHLENHFGLNVGLLIIVQVWL